MFRNSILNVLLIAGLLSVVVPTAIVSAAELEQITECKTVVRYIEGSVFHIRECKAVIGDMAQANTSSLQTSDIAPSAGSVVGCWNSMQYIRDVTVPDWSAMSAGESFDKKWLIRNTGTCAWSGYSLVYSSGAAMDSASFTGIAYTSPGATVVVSVSLRAPSTTGNHSGRWVMRSSNGKNFGGLTTVIKVPSWAATLTPAAPDSGWVAPTATAICLACLTSFEPEPQTCQGTVIISAGQYVGVAGGGTVWVPNGDQVCISHEEAAELAAVEEAARVAALAAAKKEEEDQEKLDEINRQTDHWYDKIAEFCGDLKGGTQYFYGEFGNLYSGADYFGRWNSAYRTIKQARDAGLIMPAEYALKRGFLVTLPHRNVLTADWGYDVMGVMSNLCADVVLRVLDGSDGVQYHVLFK